MQEISRSWSWQLSTVFPYLNRDVPSGILLGKPNPSQAAPAYQLHHLRFYSNLSQPLHSLTWSSSPSPVSSLISVSLSFSLFVPSFFVHAISWATHTDAATAASFSNYYRTLRPHRFPRPWPTRNAIIVSEKLLWELYIKQDDSRELNNDTQVLRGACNQRGNIHWTN